MNCGTALPAQAVPPPSVPPPAPGAAPPPVSGYPAGYPPPYTPPVGPPYGVYTAPQQADFSNIFSGTFRVWTENFLPLFVVYLVLGLLVGVLSVASSVAFYGVPHVSGGFLGIGGTTPSATDAAAYVGYELVVILIGWILASAVIGGVTDFAIRRHRGESVPIMDSMNRGFQRLLSIMGANLLVTIITSGVVLLWSALLVMGALALVTGGATASALALVCGGLLLFPLVFVLVIYLTLALSLYAPAVMAEGKHAVDSLGRSWSLTRGHKWSILAAAIVVGILLVIIDGAIVFVGAIGGNWVVELIATAIGTAITGSWITILVAVAYDLIVRQPMPTMWPPTMTPMYPPMYPPR